MDSRETPRPIFANPPCHAAQAIRVVLADDHLVVRQGIRAFLMECEDIEVVGEAASGDEAVRVCTRLCPDVVLMDLRMPDGDGIEATRAIRAAHTPTQIVILTSFVGSEYVAAAVRAGALSYLLKDATAQDILKVIRHAVKGESVLHPQAAAHLMTMAVGTQKSRLEKELSSRELEVLRLMAEGLSNASIAQQLFLSEKTVKSHVSNILSKLNVVDRTQAAVLAWRHGLMNRGEG